MYLAEIRLAFSAPFPLMTLSQCCLLTTCKSVDKGGKKKPISKHFRFHSLDHSPDPQTLFQYWGFFLQDSVHK